MRAPLRTGLLALLCALMLGIATIANANIPGRPIDRPEGPPDIDPTMVGDPDQPGGGGITVVIGRWVYVGKLPGRLGARFSELYWYQVGKYSNSRLSKPARRPLGR